MIFGRQQSNPSNPQLMVFVSSLQSPFATSAFDIPLPDSALRHSHSEQYSTLTQVPQQSPLSKLHPTLLASSLQKPLPMSSSETEQSETIKDRKYMTLF